MKAVNYKLKWTTSTGIAREQLFDTLPALRYYQLRTLKPLNVQTTSYFWENASWQQFVIVGGTILNKAQVQTLLHQFN